MLTISGAAIHYSDVIMGAIASQITSLTIVYTTVYSDADQRKYQAPRHWSLCGEFPAQMASNAENVSIWWRHHESNCDDLPVPLFVAGRWFLSFAVFNSNSGVDVPQV